MTVSPVATPGAEAGLTAEQRATMPNFVHKAGSGNDQVQVGTWTDGAVGPEGTGTAGTWVQNGVRRPHGASARCASLAATIACATG
jgi:hypothetical protein